MVYLGIDIAKRKFDVALLVDDKYKCLEFTNDIAAFKALYDWISQIDKSLLHACMESTGTYSQKLAYFLVG